MDHFYCRDCDRSEEFASEGAARGDGWDAIDTEGRAGPMAFEYTGLCPDCAA